MVPDENQVQAQLLRRGQLLIAASGGFAVMYIPTSILGCATPAPFLVAQADRRAPLVGTARAEASLATRFRVVNAPAGGAGGA